MDIRIIARVGRHILRKDYRGVTPKQAKTDFKMLYPQARGLRVHEGNRVKLKPVDTMESIFIAV